MCEKGAICALFYWLENTKPSTSQIIGQTRTAFLHLRVFCNFGVILRGARQDNYWHGVNFKLFGWLSAHVRIILTVHLSPLVTHNPIIQLLHRQRIANCMQA
ncbi:MAG: hypothetical protein [Podoviridae sp. ctKoA10]|nr:MAG: hypothetical protein [Podoviridae sp. ctKoA10]